MNRYAMLLTNSPDKRVMWPWLIAGILVYLLPWLANPGISMTLGGWDLAEWASLHPAVRFGDPNLTIPLHLRLVPVILMLIFALNSARPRFAWHWWLTLVIVLVGAIALAPPPEFLNNTGDVNYRQQFTLSVVTLIGGIIALSGVLNIIRTPLTLALAIIGVFVSYNGLQGAYGLMQGLQTPVIIGFGGILSMLIFAGMVVIESYRIWMAFQSSRHHRAMATA